MPVTLGEFAKQLGEAGITAAKACEEYALQRLKEVCDEGPNGELIPKVRIIEIFGQKVEIPEVAFLSPFRLDVDTLDFEFDATVLLGERGPVMAGHLGLLRKGVRVKAKIGFKAGDSLESLEILRERVNRQISDELAVKRG